MKVMSQDEINAIAGAALTAYVQSKRELAALAQKATTIGKAVREVGTWLEQVCFSTDSGRIANQLEEFPSADTIRALVTDIQQAQRERMKLFNRLCDLGFEPKD